jgi:hypothetical protein
MSDARVERMTRDDLALALEWAAKEGWNPGVVTWRRFWRPTRAASSY